MYYKLKKPWCLRGYEDELLTLDCAGVPGPQHRLTGALFNLLLKCDGETEITAPDDLSQKVFDHYLREGVIEACDAPSPIRPWQKYRYFEHRRVPGAFFSLTGRCNLHCQHCFAQADTLKHAKEFSLEQIEHILDQLQDCGIHALTLSGGEPLMHRQFSQIVDAIAERDMTLYRFYTNGMLFTEAIAKQLKGYGYAPELVISFDGLGVHNWMRRNERAQEGAVEAMRICREYGFPIRCAINLNDKSLPVLEETVRFLYDQGARSLFFIRTSESPEWLRTGQRCLTLDEYWKAMLDLVRRVRDLNRKDLTLQFFNGPLIVPGATAEFYRQFELPRMEDIDTHTAWCRKGQDWVNVSSTGVILPCDAFEGAALESGLMREGCNILERPLKEILMDSEYAKVMALKFRDVVDANPECGTCEWLLRCHGGDCRVGGTLGRAAQGGKGYFGKENTILCALKSPMCCLLYRGGYFDRLLEILEENP